MQTTGEGVSVQSLVDRAYRHLGRLEVVEARTALEEALSIDYEDPEVLYALKCVNWWLARTEPLCNILDPYDQGGFILSLVNEFYSFLGRIEGSYERCVFAVRRYAYLSALGCFEDILGDSVNAHDPGLLLLVGRCYKGLGDYEEALKYLLQAVQFKREDSEALSHLADVHALLGDAKKAKVLFREAFFIDPQKVDLMAMESEMIQVLVEKVRRMGYESPELEEWIPVYGAIFGVFSVRRQLTHAELGRIKQSIFSLENEVRQDTSRKPVALPRLINRYFWLLDHYVNRQEEPGLIEETMLKIKVLDPEIYNLYRQ